VTIDQGGNRAGKDGRGIGQHAAPVAGMMPAVAQLDVEVYPDSAAAAEEDGRAIRREPGSIGGQKQIGLEFVA
jgi:hypothetical protein